MAIIEGDEGYEAVASAWDGETGVAIVGEVVYQVVKNDGAVGFVELPVPRDSIEGGLRSYYGPPAEGGHFVPEAK